MKKRMFKSILRFLKKNPDLHSKTPVEKMLTESVTRNFFQRWG